MRRKHRSPETMLRAGQALLPRLRALMPGFDLGVFIDGAELVFSAAKALTRVSVRVTAAGEPAVIATYLTQKWHRAKEVKAA